MSFRIFFAAYKGYQWRRALRKVIRDADSRLALVSELNPEWLAKNQLKSVILDFDGVLAVHGADKPTERVQSWLASFLTQFPADHLWIYSNSPTQQREDFFAAHFPGVRWIKPPPKKPYPNALSAWLLTQEVSKEQVVLVDDRLLTGVLCALLCGVKPLWIEKPLIDFKQKTCLEVWTVFSRAIERTWFTYF